MFRGLFQIVWDARIDHFQTIFTEHIFYFVLRPSFHHHDTAYLSTTVRETLSSDAMLKNCDTTLCSTVMYASAVNLMNLVVCNNSTVNGRRRIVLSAQRL